jgi:predicted RNA-binding Zn-ribbon protein involved in translation (DUF1610 family)
MKQTLSFVSLKCLNCSANLKISQNITQFACEHCGAAQIVVRDGGVVALQMLSDKIDRVQNTVDKTAAELALQRFGKEFDELTEKHARLEDLAAEMKKYVDQAFFLGLGVIVVVTLVCLVNSLIVGIILGVVLTGGAITAWLNKRKSIDAEMQSNSKPLISKAIEIKKKMVELEKIIES